MTFQKRLQRIMKRKDWRVADLARELGERYTTVREWVLHGRSPRMAEPRLKKLNARIAKLET